MTLCACAEPRAREGQDVELLSSFKEQERSSREKKEEAITRKEKKGEPFFQYFIFYWLTGR